MYRLNLCTSFPVDAKTSWNYLTSATWHFETLQSLHFDACAGKSLRLRILFLFKKIAAGQWKLFFDAEPGGFKWAYNK